MKTQQELQGLFKEFLEENNVNANIIAVGPRGAHVAIENFLTMPNDWLMSILFTEVEEATPKEEAPKKPTKPTKG